MLDCEKRPYLREFLDEPDTPLDIQVAPPGFFLKWLVYFKTPPLHQTFTNPVLKPHHVFILCVSLS